MILPKGEVVHQGLSTVYTDTAELLSTLVSDGFAGIVEVVLPGNKGVFFISSGMTINAFIEGDGDQIVAAGQEAIQKLIALSKQQEGILNVMSLTPAEVEFAASPFGSEIIHKGLSTNFVKLDRFIQKLKEERHNGFIEVITGDNKPMGTIFLKEGELVGFHTASSGSNTLTEPEAIPAFLGEISRQGATFNVHQTAFGVSQKAAPSPKEPSSMRDIFPTKEPAPQKETFVLSEPAPAKEAFVPKEPPIAKETLADKEVDEIAREIFMDEPPPPAKAEHDIIREEKESLEKGWVAVNKDRNGRNEIVVAAQKVLSKVEQFVDGSSQKGAFQRVFKNTLIEKSDLYPFLDPFAGQFNYNEGKITLDEEIDLDKFSMGIADCFSVALYKIKREFPKAMTLPVGLKADIESSLRYYQDLADHGEID